MDGLGLDRDGPYQYVYRWLWGQRLLNGVAMYAASITIVLLVSVLGSLVLAFASACRWTSTFPGTA